MSQQVLVKIELENGKEINHYSSLKIRQNLFKHHKFELTVPFEVLEDEDEHFFKSAHKTVCGKSISFSFDSEYDKNAKSKFKYVFKGIITEIELSNKGDLANKFVIRGYSPTILLEDYTVKRTFHQMSIGDIFSKVLNEYAANLLKRKLKARNTSPVKYLVQYNETNFEFLSRLASEYGEWFYYDGQQLLLGRPENSDEVDFMIDGIQSFDMSISLNPSKFKLRAYDYGSDKEFEADASSHNVDGISQFGKFALDQSDQIFPQTTVLVAEKPIYSQSDLNDLAKVKKAVAASELIVFEGSGEVPDISVGTVIHVKGSVPAKGGRSSEQDFGKYMITKITHLVDDSGNYSNNFEAVPQSVQYPPPNSYVKYPVGQTELAKVTNNDDPDKLGRVKVAFLWSGNDNSSDWIRVGSFYSGNDNGKGMFFVPEVGAQVLVDYELNHPEYPFVVTSLYPKKSGTRNIKGSNEEKIFFTQAGNQIVLTDKQNENKIEITNENKTDTTISLEFKDNGIISIKTNGKVEISANEDISIKAGKNLSLEAVDIKIKASKDLQCEGTKSANVKGAMVEIKGDASAKLQGAMTEVSGSGMTTITGGLVKIN
jgi:uncharacterized protein involved in type VI secretion and phage assembly